jgi:hypothetical protein
MQHTSKAISAYVLSVESQIVMEHTADSNHSEEAVLELNKLAARKRVGVLAATEGVEVCRVLQ